MIRVRFAPSPTGNLHIGGARTAVFNWMYARSQNGTFVLRIEDTDRERSKQEYFDEIVNSLSWLGFHWDELYHQSERADIYRSHADRLLKAGVAYVEKTEGKGEAVIYKVPAKTVVLKDIIRGDIVFDSSVIKDQVLIKSDGTPTYNFACVVDDALMRISHVIRGDDHISNTPKQILLYEALGFDLPRFAHLPLIMGMDGGRLSKRTGATAISDYRRMGYLAPALVNYLLLLSWSPGDNREIIDVKDAIKLFDITAVNKTAATFNLEKLNWINSQHIKACDTGELVDLVIPRLEEAGLIQHEGYDRAYISSVVDLFKGRLPTLADFPDWADFFFLQDVRIDPAARAKHLSKDYSKEFSLFASRIQGLDPFTVTSIEQCFRALVAELGTDARTLIHPVRVALTGKTIGPGLFEVIYYLGKDRTRARLEKFVVTP